MSRMSRPRAQPSKQVVESMTPSWNLIVASIQLVVIGYIVCRLTNTIEAGAISMIVFGICYIVGQVCKRNED